MALAGMFGLICPDEIRPVKIRPKNGSASSVVANIVKGPSSIAGGGT